MISKLTLILVLMLSLNGCQSKEAEEEAKKQAAYVDFAKFKEGRPCAEVRFMCLPESQDKSWQSVPTEDGIEDLELTPEVEQKYKKIVKEWHEKYDAYYNDAYYAKPHPKGEKKPMLISSLDKDFFEKVEQRRFLEEMEQELEKEFPGFWRDVPKKVRYRWIRRAMNKAKRFGYTKNKPGPMVELCARIGLDFDKDPKWEYIVKFITSDSKNIGTNMGIACDYIDWTIFNKPKGYSGVPITDWSMRRAHPGLPWPQKPYPRLNDL